MIKKITACEGNVDLTKHLTFNDCNQKENKQTKKNAKVPKSTLD